MHIVDEKEELYWFWATGWKVKVNFGTWCMKAYGHDTDYMYSDFQITVKLHMKVVDNGRMKPFEAF